MAVDLTRATSQVTQLLNAGVRDSAGVPTFSADVGDNAFHADEIENNVYNAGMLILTAICETDGHPQRPEFLMDAPATHGAKIPHGFGSIGTPKITPYEDADFTLAGVELTPEEIQAYRQNPNQIYSETAHNEKYEDDRHSELAGFYAVDGLMFYFTGFSAVLPVARFARTDVATKIPDAYEPTLVKLAVGMSAKDGMLSDISAFYMQQGMGDLALIRLGKEIIPKILTYQNARGSGAK